jgi:hypothetical protein
MNLDADSSVFKLARRFHGVQQNNAANPPWEEKNSQGGIAACLEALIQEGRQLGFG